VIFFMPTTTGDDGVTAALEQRGHPLELRQRSDSTPSAAPSSNTRRPGARSTRRVYFSSETPFLLWFAAYCIFFFLFAWVWQCYWQVGFQASLHQAGWLLLPMVLLLIPASFWSDIPGTGWWIHASYHDGRGDYPLLHVFKPRYIALLTLAWLVYWGWKFGTHEIASRGDRIL
jgi:hypothetical protein